MADWCDAPKVVKGMKNLAQATENPSLSNPATDTSPQWNLSVWLIALLPLTQAILTWDLDGKLTGMQYAIRHISIPAVVGEIIILGCALKMAMSLSNIWRMPSNATKALIAIWLAFAVTASLLPEINKTGSLFWLLRFVLHGLFFAAVIHIINKTKCFTPSYWFLAISVGIIGYIAALSLFALIVPDPANFRWALRMPSATNIRQIANITAVAAVAPVALILFGDKIPKWQPAAMIFAIISFIGWSGSRTALIALIASCLTALVFVRIVPKITNLLTLLGSLIAGLIASLFLPSPAPVFGLYRMFNKMQETDNVSSGRVQFWQDTIAEISKNPWLGYGTGRFRGNMDAVYGTGLNHPHNFILQFTYDWGVFGAGAALILIASLLWTCWKNATAYPLPGFGATAAC